MEYIAPIFRVEESSTNVAQVQNCEITSHNDNTLGTYSSGNYVKTVQ
jgi:hypothetical protein